MWPFKSRAERTRIKAERAAEKARIKAGRAEWAAFTEAAASGDPSAVRAALTQLQASSDAEALPDYERADHSRAAFRAYAEKVLADGLGDEQRAVWDELFQALALKYEDNLLDLGRRFLIVDVASRRPEALSKSKLLARAGEEVFIEVPAGRWDKQPVAVQGVVIGRWPVVTEEGTLSITSDRVVFLGESRSIEFAYDQIVAAHWAKDGVRFQVANAETLTLKMADGLGEVVGAMINGRNNPPRAAP